MDHINAGAADAWADDTHSAETRAVFKEKKQVLLNFFEEVGLEVAASEATFYLWVRVPGDGDDQKMAYDLLRRGIVVTPGSMLGVSTAGAGYVRVALVPNLEECQAAVAVWRRAREKA